MTSYIYDITTNDITITSYDYVTLPPHTLTPSHTHLHGVRVEGVLYVALADHSKMADCLDGNRTKEVVLVVAKRLRGRHDDRLPWGWGGGGSTV